MPLMSGNKSVLKSYIGEKEVKDVIFNGNSLMNPSAQLPVENLILIGASIENFTFNGTADHADFQARIAATVPAASGRVTVYNESENGRPTSAARQPWPQQSRRHSKARCCMGV